MLLRQFRYKKRKLSLLAARPTAAFLPAAKPSSGLKKVRVVVGKTGLSKATIPALNSLYLPIGQMSFMGSLFYCFDSSILPTVVELSMFLF